MIFDWYINNVGWRNSNLHNYQVILLPTLNAYCLLLLGSVLSIVKLLCGYFKIKNRIMFYLTGDDEYFVFG